jgi:nitrogen regulatory protein PII
MTSETTSMDDVAPEGMTLHSLKKLEVIVHGEDLPTVQDLMADANVTGYTLVRDVAGLGHHGFHEGRLLFNEQASLVMLIAVAPPAAIRTVIAGLRELFERHSGVMFVSDTHVVRLDHFLPDGGGD